MTLVELLDIRSIELDFPKRKKHQIVERLVDLVALAHPVSEPSRLVREILQRDNDVSTAIGDGVALPHRLTSLVTGPAMAFVQTRKPAGFATPDGIPVRLCFLLLAPEGAVQEHLRTLSRLARILHDSRFREDLFNAQDPEVVRSLIRDHEQ